MPDKTMTVAQALGKIYAPKGMTSMIAGALSGDFDPLRPQNGFGVTLHQAEEKLEFARQAQENCSSDWAYWGYTGDIAYWRAVVNILKAAALVGDDALPDVDPGNLQGMVMDSCSRIEKYGETILRYAETIHREEAAKSHPAVIYDTGTGTVTPVPDPALIDSFKADLRLILGMNPDRDDFRAALKQMQGAQPHTTDAVAFRAIKLLEDIEKGQG